MINKNNNIYEIIDNDAKVIKLKYLFKIKKGHREDVFYAAIAKELLAKRTACLDEMQFNILKLELYNAVFSINVIDSKDELLFIYQVSFVNPKYVADLQLEKIKKVFMDFIANREYDISYLNMVIDMEKLELIDILQDYRELANIKNKDNLFKENEYYLTFEQNKHLVDNLELPKLNNFIQNIKVENPIIIYSGPDKIMNLDNFIHNEIEEGSNYYDFSSGKDVIVNYDLDQAVIKINYEFNHQLDHATKTVLNQMIGSGSSSILFKQIREKLNLCYYVYSNFIEGNILSVAISTSIDKVELALDEINTIILDLDNYINETLFKLVVDLRCEKLKSYVSNKNLQEQLILSNILHGYDYEIDKLIESTKQVKYTDIELSSKAFKLINKTIVR